MCLLTYLPPQVMPDSEALRNGATTNRDGHGYAIVVPGDSPRLIVRHSLNAKGLIKRFAGERAKYPDGPALFHSRYGTSGVIGKFNCHPFNLSGDAQTVIAHNGVLPAHLQPGPNDRRCDTRMAADEIFGRAYGHLRKDASRQRLADAVGTYNKLVILTVSDEFDAWAYIVNEEQGIWDGGGSWYSNDAYLPAVRRGWSGRSVSLYDDDCEFCGTKYAVGIARICDTCFTCDDCGALIDDCLCWPSAKSLSEDERDAERAAYDWYVDDDGRIFEMEKGGDC